ncbi:aminotransferase class III-fold pyridoxal phosphate-dependent enzyme [Paraburkholderia caribensis]|uniref:Diaminobutyrate--2-oxoglutarate transaminase n=2 Tax=Paraburkholderia TaxID=1822464 RepID=B2JY56_PARP8|nr:MULTISPECIES: aminotransferase class III-fold pyridoxal phosphate-dependent enzyme [Paraburkholderia]ACC76564.1 aminotransferase class-III [Paraburkholderia phymatum STM815]MCO4881984.1 aminotransferase class III-fold pyridoxal phosphate-dependent enzyme [Paraburkholderia caribensis]
MSKNECVFSKANSPLLKQPGGSQLPLIERGRGIYLYDRSGRDYIDGSGGAMTVSIGHGVREVLDVMSTQADKVCFTYRTQFSSEPAENLAESITALAPEGLDKVFFVNSGSEATELALRTAQQYWRIAGKPEKTHVLGRAISYHGMTMGALSMSGHNARRSDYGNLLHTFAVAPPPYPFRFPLEGTDAEAHGAMVWDRIIREYGPERVAAVIVEPVVGAAGGALTPPIGYLHALRQICDRHDVLLISDEVITGMGRTGRWFACEHDGISPDMIATGKGMTSGYTPMGAVLFHRRIHEAFRDNGKIVPFGHTFSANPLSAAVCDAVIHYMRENDVLANVERRGAQLEEGLRRLSARFPWMADVRGRGLLWGFEFVTDAITKAAPDPARNANTEFVAHCFDAGLIVYSAGIAPYNNSTLLAPPLVISEEEMDELLKRLETALTSFGAAMKFSA